MIRKCFISGLLFFAQHIIYCQVIQPDLQDTTQWKVVNRQVRSIDENGKKGIMFNEVADDGFMILNGADFANGTIECDIKGSSKMQQSFVGIAFHGQDITHYDVIYFRPFNFNSDDAVRRSHSVQYISSPDYGWEKLRNEFPGKYENKITAPPGADDWFHAKIVVDGKTISVFVNGETQPSLQVEKLNSNNNGGIALWVGDNSAGSFANLKIEKSNAPSPSAQNIPYGNNPAAGHYFNVGDVKIYYEIYGSGKPIVLLHGGVYGYIDEFTPFIQKLSEKYQVICIATRGHGKSEIGDAFTNFPCCCYCYRCRVHDVALPQ